MKAPFEASIAHARLFFSLTSSDGVVYHVPFSTVQCVSVNRDATILSIRTSVLSILIHGTDLLDAARWISDHHLVSGCVGSAILAKAPSASEIKVTEVLFRN
jgi:hypothetical protein